MKIRMVVFLVLAFLWSTDLFSEFSKQEAIDLVLKNLLVSDVGKVNIYVKDSPMTQPAVLIQNKGADIILPYTVNWIFFIDDNPDLLWKHNCRYCFVSASNGDYNIQAGDFYPSNVYNDFYCISTFEHPTLPQCLLPPPIIPDPYFPETNSHLWAVLICGDELNNDIAGWADDEAFWNTASGFYCALRENGFMESNIIVHYGEGTGPNEQTVLDGENSSDIDFQASKGSVSMTFHYLQQHLTPNDHLVVITISHGFYDMPLSEQISYICLPGPDDPNDPLHQNRLYDHELASMVRNINASEIIFSINCCYSGGFADNLMNDTTATCNHRAINTMCGMEPGVSELWMTRGPVPTENSVQYTSRYMEFALYWTAAARGIYPYFEPHFSQGNHDYNIIIPWRRNGAYIVGDIPFDNFSSFDNILNDYPQSHEDYPDYFPEQYDGNNDGIMQLHEVFRYANNFDTQSDDRDVIYQYDSDYSMPGYFNPNVLYPDELPPGHEHPQEQYSSPVLSQFLTLRGLGGTVIQPSAPLILEGNYVIANSLILDGFSEIQVEPNSKITILNGSLIIREGSSLSIGTGSYIYTQSSHPAIIVEGSISIGNEVCFVSLDGIERTALFLNNCDPLSISNVSFENCSLRSENTGLSVVNSTFLNSSISQRSKSLNVSGCSFSNSNINAYQAGSPPRTDQVTVYGSAFSDYNGCAIKVTGYPNYIIERDTLNNVGNSRNSAIEISESGSGGLYSILDNVINDCLNAGIRLYHSYAKISTENQITRCENGIVALRESSWRAGGNTAYPYQILSDNENYELYFSYDSAPESFSTVIIDHGIYNTPYVMCINVPPIHNRVDLSYNCWEGNFIPINDLQPSGLYIYLPYWTPGNKSAVEDSLCKAILGDAVDSIEDGNLNTAKNLLESLVSTYPDNQYAASALKRLYQIAIMMESDLGVLKTYYQDSSISENSNLSNVAEYLATQCDIGLGNYTQAITWFEDIIMSPPTVIDSLFAQIDLGYLYMSMPDSTKYQCRYPGYRPTSWTAFEQTKSALIAMITGNSYENTDNSNVPTPSVSNFPNPFNPSTTIRFSIPQDSSVKLVVYNIRGQIIKTIVNDTLPKGSHSAFWNGVDENGRAVSSGVYFYRLQTGNSTLTGKCLLLK